MGRGDEFNANPWLQKSKVLNWKETWAGANQSDRFARQSYSTFVSKSGVTVNGMPSKNTRRVYQHEFENKKANQNIQDADMTSSWAGGRRHYAIGSSVDFSHPDNRYVQERDRGVERIRNTKFFGMHTSTSIDHPLNTFGMAGARRPTTAPGAGGWEVATVAHGVVMSNEDASFQQTNRRHTVKHLYDDLRVAENLRDDQNVEKQRNLKTDFVHKYEKIREEQQDLRIKYPHGVPKSVHIETQKKLLDVGKAGFATDMHRPFTRAGYRP